MLRGSPAAPIPSITSTTLIRWRVDHLGVTPYFGIFGQSTGSLTLDPKNPAAAKVDITIPVSKVLVASPGLTAHLLRAPEKVGGKPDFFGPNPADAHFVSTAVVADTVAGTAKIRGNLTINGVTKPVTLDTSFYGAATMPKEMGGGEMIGFEARSTIKRSDFGIDMGIPHGIGPGRSRDRRRLHQEIGSPMPDLRTLLLIGVASLTLAACTQPEAKTAQAPAPAVTPVPSPTAQPAPPSESAKPEPAADECGASRLGSYMGQPATADTMAKIKQTIGHGSVRTINPGDAVTMDFRPDRLNVEIGEDGRIKRLRCG